MKHLEEIRKEARRLLEEGTVKYVVGYRRAKGGLMAAPAFVRDPDGVDSLVWDPTCVQNLVKFLVDEKRRRAREREPDTRPVGLFVKGCDSRAVNVLLQERFIERGDVFLVGVSCGEAGMIDPAKLARAVKDGPVTAVAFAGGAAFTVSTADGETTVEAGDVLAGRCIECRAPSPVVFDVLIGEKATRSPAEPFGSVEALEALSDRERYDFWREHFSRCVRCYACRSACPMCFCTECVVDSINLATGPETSAEEKAARIKWIERSSTTADNFGYHLVRAIHLAGRCIDCGECDRACPVGIPLRLLNKKMEKAARERYGYEAGFETDTPALVSNFADGDPEEFIR